MNIIQVNNQTKGSLKNSMKKAYFSSFWVNITITIVKKSSKLSIFIGDAFFHPTSGRQSASTNADSNCYGYDRSICVCSNRPRRKKYPRLRKCVKTSEDGRFTVVRRLPYSGWLFRFTFSFLRCYGDDKHYTSKKKIIFVCNLPTNYRGWVITL